MNFSTNRKPHNGLLALCFEHAFKRNAHLQAEWVAVKYDGQLLAHGKDGQMVLADQAGIVGRRKSKLTKEVAATDAATWRMFDEYSLIVRF